MDGLLLVVDSLAAGGAERHVVDLAVALVGRGRQVDVACSAGGPLERDLRRAGVPVHVVGGAPVKRRACPTYAARLAGLVRLLQPAVVHAHVHASEVAAAQAVQGRAVPLVLTEHTEAPWRDGADTADARRACAGAAAVVAVSSAVGRALVQDLGVPRERVELVLPAVLPTPALRVPRPAGTPPTLLCAGRLAPEKGVDLLLEVFPVVRDEVPGARLRIAGDGPERPRLERLAAGLAGVELLGFRTDVAALLRRADVLVVPSRSDGSPLVVAEANAAGAAVVAHAVGGLPDRVRHGVDGLLVPPGDPGALAGALVRVLRENTLRARLAAAGTARAAGETHEAMVDRLEALYARVAGRTTSAAASAAIASQNLERTGLV